MKHLPSTIPQVQQQVPHKSDVAVLDVDGSTKSSDVLCHIVAEDDRSHRRLARTRAAHEQHLALLLALATLRRTHGDYRRPECLAAQREYMYVLFMLFRTLIAFASLQHGFKAQALPATPTPLCDGGVLALTTLFKACEPIIVVLLLTLQSSFHIADYGSLWSQISSMSRCIRWLDGIRLNSMPYLSF